MTKNLQRLVTLALLVTTAQAFSQTSTKDFAIVGARVEIGNGEILDSATVFVHDGKIASIQKGSESFPIPVGINQVDARGKTLYPGFIDAFSTLGVKLPTTPAQVARPGTTTTAPATMWIANRKGIQPEFKVAESLDFTPGPSLYNSGITTLMISSGRGGMRGWTAIVDALPDSDKARVRVASFGASMSFRTGAGQGYPSNILGSIALLRQTFTDAQSLMNGVELSTATPKPDWMSSLESLAPVLKRDAPVLFEANTVREIERAVKLSEEFGFKLIIVGGREAGRVANLLAQKKVPVILFVDYAPEPLLKNNDDTLPADQTPVEVRKERHDKWDEITRGDQALAKAGVQFVFSSEGNSGGLLAAVQKRIAKGLDRNTALKAMTSTSAEFFGIQRELGTIAVGHVANLVLMDGDFANEKTKVTHVWIKGIPVLAPEKRL